MAKRLININIDLSKINKAKIKVRANGSKYYDMVAIETPGGKYGEWMIVESQSKEEREAKKNGTILGNGKNFGWEGGSSSSGSSRPTPPPVSSEDLGF